MMEGYEVSSFIIVVWCTINALFMEVSSKCVWSCTIKFVVYSVVWADYWRVGRTRWRSGKVWGGEGETLTHYLCTNRHAREIKNAYGGRALSGMVVWTWEGEGGKGRSLPAHRLHCHALAKSRRWPVEYEMLTPSGDFTLFSDGVAIAERAIIHWLVHESLSRRFILV